MGRKRRFESAALEYVYAKLVGNDEVQATAFVDEVANAEIGRQLYDLRTNAGLTQGGVANYPRTHGVRRSRRILAVCLISSAMIPLGCVKRHLEGNTSTYAIETWVIAVVALAAVSACVAGWYVRSKRKWLGSIVLGSGVLVLCTTVPGLSVSRTTIAPDHVEWNRGFNHFNFQFDELGAIEHTVKRIPIGRTVQDVHYLDFTRKSGERVHIQVNPGSDRFLQDAIPEIISRAEERGVPCTEEAPD